MRLAPLRGVLSENKPWEGECRPLPWHYKATVVLPHLDSSDDLPLLLRLWRAQTVRPFIQVIDTGSTHVHLEKTLALEANDLEVHCLRPLGMQHPADAIAWAMDLAFATARTPYLIATHTDCFPVQRHLIDFYINTLESGFDVVGFQMSARPPWPTDGIPSHTMTGYSVRAMDRIDANWSLRRWSLQQMQPRELQGAVAVGWPDTEVQLGYQIQRHKLRFFKLGVETNGERQVTDWFDHARSKTASMLYSPDYHGRCVTWYEAAVKDATERAERWEKEPTFKVRYKP